MIEFDLSKIKDFTMTSKDGAAFLPLGIAPEKILKSKVAAEKVRGLRKNSISQLWGTLGMVNNHDIDFKGRLRYSERGNLESTSKKSKKLTLDEIELFKSCRDDKTNKSREAVIIERFIDFKDVKFENFPKIIRRWEDIPKIRLTLFLSPDQGAVTYYQFDKDHPMNPEKGKGAIEYIQPNKTKNFDCSSRDRLTYEIPIVPKTALEPLENGLGFKIVSGTKNKQSMLIKILVGKRKHSNSDTILKRLHYHLFGHTHQLLIWNKSLKAFVPEDKSVLDTTINKRILFMIHGTFSNTKNAFLGLIEGKGGANSWLSKVSDQNKYDKIIAFDHPTISENPEQNASALIERLPLGFHANMDVITHSRGALLGKYLCYNLPQLQIRRGALVAGANGVGYFTVGWGVSKFLSILKYSGGMQKLIAGIAQHSIDWFLAQPGCQSMTPGSDTLKSILNADMRGKKKPEFLPIVGDYTKELVANQPFWNRLGQNGLDLVIKLALGKEHDWVVGSKEQAIVKPGKLPGLYNNYKSTPYPYPARHSDYFQDTYVQSLLGQFLFN